MTTYKLPDWLGGYEVNRLTDAATPGRVNVTLSKGEGLIIEIDLKDLNEVKPPLPPEPKPWAVVADTHAGVWQRIGKEPAPWRCTDGRSTDWEHLAVSLGPLTRLIPDPADDPALVERVAQAMRDANAAEAWDQPWEVPFGHFAKVAVDTILGAAWEAQP